MYSDNSGMMIPITTGNKKRSGTSMLELSVHLHALLFLMIVDRDPIRDFGPILRESFRNEDEMGDREARISRI
jgi:hypothetical protein